MTDEHTNHAEGDGGPSRDRSLERRSSDSRGPSARPDGERAEGLGADGTVPANSYGHAAEDHALEGELLDQAVREEIAHQVMAVTRIAPLPEPRELLEYDQIEPGLANRIVAMAEKSADAANAATLSNAEVNNALASSIREDAYAVRRGQWMFTVLAVLFLLSAVGLALIGNTPFAIAMGVLGFLSGAGVLIRPVNQARWKPASKEDGSGREEA
ncbi:DUF2335 domain-containing protein [Corynebacterium humireducens]|uniref:DUF2335 domain-containing protein n=1 Tax=Corynebacterium humireducens TaxID=1223514 RepID=UPI0009E31B0A|nr:DUF2335 domain-containing protein [Corynebacterium humireducens]